MRSTGPSPSPTAASVGEGGGPGDDDDDDADPASPLAPATHSLAATHAAMSERHRARVAPAVARAARPIHPCAGGSTFEYYAGAPHDVIISQVGIT